MTMTMVITRGYSLHTNNCIYNKVLSLWHVNFKHCKYNRKHTRAFRMLKLSVDTMFYPTVAYAV